ncbi:MAG TPA: alpha-amylase family glycosyl hydrolase [Ohtaekwangia sp.]|nr:alpha-amylase family glycosyl hydrolase [Ohtaekwangia sp.]
MKSLLLLMTSTISVWSFGQAVGIDPSISPALFKHNTPITVTYDVTGTALANLTSAYAWVWIPGQSLDAKYNITPASSNATLTNNAKFTKSTADGKTLFTLTFTPADFFTGDISGAEQLGILLKGNDWSNGQTKDYVTEFWAGDFEVRLLSPTQQPLFVDNGDDFEISAEAPVNANFELYINNVLIDQQDGIINYSYTHTVTETSGYGTVELVATDGTSEDALSFQYLISGTSPAVARPEGIIPGINYHDGDDTRATVCLWAPGKSSVYALGDFTEWKVLPEYLMNQDGEYFWIEISGLTAGEEYAFQYLVDEFVYMADPYADKILDPDDQYIPASSYPGLEPYPAAALHNEWYFNRAAVIQTAQQPFEWQVENFEKPAKEKLVVYELLVRDFFEDGQRNYQNLIDTIAYFKRLGINAIELMPIMEFNGNESWGYNPTAMFAVDKYYGTKDKFKEFVDVCHQNGIAVILDIAMNHQNIPNAYVLMDFDFDTFKPKPTNKWFNPDARHPFNVFYDMNHESTYTQAYLDTVNYHWLNEYKVDGFRFDLSKGFTQTNNPDNVNAWSAYDASRIAILKRMADAIWEHTPDAYVILEHLSVNSEEKELAEYRADEGKGMMLWGKMTDQYNQNTMGFAASSDVSGAYYASRNWDVPHLVSYMESHDEERLMYKNLLHGGTAGAYNVKKLTTAIERMKAANTIFYTIPGPKMLWQFGEVGYDYSINHCPDGSNSGDCRVANKPVRWDYYLENGPQKTLYNHTAEIINLRNEYDVFTEGEATFSGNATLLKQVTIKNVPYTETPVNPDEMNVQVAANFDLTAKNIMVAFPHTGTWYDYYREGEPLNVTTTPFEINLPAGGYKLFTDVAIQPSIVTDAERALETTVSLYPNPVDQTLIVETLASPIHEVSALTIQGARIYPARLSSNAWDVRTLAPGLYIVEVRTREGVVRKKVVKE